MVGENMRLFTICAKRKEVLGELYLPFYLRGDREDIGDHHKKEMVKGRC